MPDHSLLIQTSQVGSSVCCFEVYLAFTVRLRSKPAVFQLLQLGHNKWYTTLLHSKFFFDCCSLTSRTARLLPREAPRNDQCLISMVFLLVRLRHRICDHRYPRPDCIISPLKQPLSAFFACLVFKMLSLFSDNEKRKASWTLILQVVNSHQDTTSEYP